MATIESNFDWMEPSDLAQLRRDVQCGVVSIPVIADIRSDVDNDESRPQKTLFEVYSPMAKRKPKIVQKIESILEELDGEPLGSQVDIINQIKLALHDRSPFKDEPVDCVLWVHSDDVQANDYNPNSVAPPEMRLLERSIEADGYTQPIVTFKRDAVREVVDGFHRNRVGKESEIVRGRVKGYLPVVTINSEREDRGDRIAATIRHNRARGKHRVDSMSEIVLELKRRNWSDSKIGKELGMDPDEVLRLTQITGLAEMFSNREFSEAWEADTINESDNLSINEEATGEGDASL